MPRKPRKDNRFPLRLHATGQWTKMIGGIDRYFGTDREVALERYVRERDDLKAGRVPREREEGEISVADLCNDLLNSKKLKVTSGELTPGTWSQYRGACKRMIECFGRDTAVAGLRPDDFERLRGRAAAGLGPKALGQFVVLVRSVLKWGYETERLKVPIRVGPDFKPPPKRVLRLAREKRGKRLLTAPELRAMLAAADPQMRAMIYLGLNCGYGGTDCARLNRADVAREPGWLAGVRVKSGSDRRCPLWGETMEALAMAATVRPMAKLPMDSDAVFLTRMGRRWVRVTDRAEKSANYRDSIGTAFARLAGRCGVKLVGRFYTLRHVFRTVADETHDKVAIDLIMGHVDPGMGAVYREGIDDARLVRVTEHVRTWLTAH